MLQARKEAGGIVRLRQGRRVASTQWFEPGLIAERSYAETIRENGERALSWALTL